MPRPKASEQIDMEAAIRAAAWEQITKLGAPALSLRGIARAIGISAPAIYNYFASLDDLVTELIIEAYTSLGDWQVAACERVPTEDLTGRLFTIGIAYRGWAIIYPQRYQLIFGTPIPGYVAPIERVLPSATRSLSVLVGSVDDLRQAGRLRLDQAISLLPDKEAEFETWKKAGGEVDIRSFTIALRIWGRVHGQVSLEINGSFPPYFPAEESYHRELADIMTDFVQGGAS